MKKILLNTLLLFFCTVFIACGNVKSAIAINGSSSSNGFLSQISDIAESFLYTLNRSRD